MTTPWHGVSPSSTLGRSTKTRSEATMFLWDAEMRQHFSATIKTDLNIRARCRRVDPIRMPPALSPLFCFYLHYDTMVLYEKLSYRYYDDHSYLYSRNHFRTGGCNSGTDCGDCSRSRGGAGSLDAVLDMGRKPHER